MTEIISIGGAVITALVSAVLYLYRENRKLAGECSRCQSENMQLRTQFLSLNALVEQAGWAGSTTLDAIIVANEEMVIMEWNPGATILLHWTAREALGKNVSMLVPQEYRDRYQQAVSAWRARDDPPRRGPYLAWAITKDGALVPVEVTLSGWRLSEKHFVAACFRRRIAAVNERPADQDCGSCP